MSLFNAGIVILFLCLIVYLFRHRLPRLRQYLRITLVLGILLVLVGSYVDRRSLAAGFKAGQDLAGRKR